MIIDIYKLENNGQPEDYEVDITNEREQFIKEHDLLLSIEILRNGVFVIWLENVSDDPDEYLINMVNLEEDIINSITQILQEYKKKYIK